MERKRLQYLDQILSASYSWSIPIHIHALDDTAGNPGQSDTISIVVKNATLIETAPQF